MTLVRRAIGSSLEYGHPDLYAKSAPGTILQDTAMASMSGTLAQLGLLSHYATEIFSDVFAITEEIHARVAARHPGARQDVMLRVRAQSHQPPRVRLRVDLI